MSLKRSTESQRYQRALKTMLQNVLILALILVLTSCATIGASVKRGVESAPCKAFHPVYIHPGDVLTKRTADAILSNNETGYVICHWKKKHELKLNN